MRWKAAMNPEIRSSKLYYRVCLFLLFFVTASATFNGFYAKYHFYDWSTWTIAPLRLDAMLDGTGFRPFIYRQMLPTAANWIDGATPEAVKTWLFNRATPGPQVAGRDVRFPDRPRSGLFLPLPGRLFRHFSFCAAGCVRHAHGLPGAGSESDCSGFCPGRLHSPASLFSEQGRLLLRLSRTGAHGAGVWAALKFDWFWILPIAALGTWNKESFLLFIPALYPISGSGPLATARSWEPECSAW